MWKGKCILNGESSNSQGVAVLLNPNFEYNIMSVSKDIDGNMIVRNLNIGDISIKLLNIYAPIKIHQNLLVILEILLNQISKLIYFYVGI